MFVFLSAQGTGKTKVVYYGRLAREFFGSWGGVVNKLHG